MRYNFFPAVIFVSVMVLSCEKPQQTAAKDNFGANRSTFFSTVYIENKGYDTPGHGDLWPSAWSDDGQLYAANGDGKGFDPSGDIDDIVINKIDGHPEKMDIRGERLAARIGVIWGDTAMYNRKPTGMVSINGTLYLAVQDLNKGTHIFNEAPAATILRSDDKGRTWKGNKEKPMFDHHHFTTIIFLDYGQDSQDNIFDDYVYAYGLDNNWRDSFSDVVDDPLSLYLARVPSDHVQDADQWEFYTGNLQGNPGWSAPGDIRSRQPVLRDDRRRYTTTFAFKGVDSLSVISQGGIVYNQPLKRYIYTSWTEYTFEFYESPTPWGPWKLFLSHDFGAYPWTDQKYGGYATVIPSKFISANGQEMWVSSSTFAGQSDHYNFSLRRLFVHPFSVSSPSNPHDPKNIVALMSLSEGVPISAKNVRNGDLRSLNDGIRDQSIDSYSTEIKPRDYWGYTFAKAYHMNKVEYITGKIDAEGGWFEDIAIEVRQNFKWLPVKGLAIDNPYPFNPNVPFYASYQFTFQPTWGDGIRLIGRPGGEKQFTSISELGVFYE